MSKKAHIPWILGLGLLMETLDSTILNPALPQMALTFAVNTLTLKLAIISYFITLAIFIPVSGYATDRWGTKRVLFIATIVFLLSSLLCGLSKNLPELIIGRLLQGAGGAMVAPVGRLILLKTFARTDFIKAFTSLIVVGQMGVVLGPTLGGILTTFLGWRWVFFINLPVGVLMLVFIVRVIPNYREEIRYHFDKIGFMLFSVAVGLITFGLALATEESFENMGLVAILLTIGVIAFFAYVWHAQHCHLPLLKLNLLRILTFRIAVLGSFLSRLALNTPFFLLTLLLQIEFHFSAFAAGLFLMPYGLMMVAAKPYVQKILHHYGFRRSLRLNPVLLALLFLMFAQITIHTPAWVILLLVGLLGMSSSFQFTCMNALNFADIEKKDMSHASIISSVVQQLAMSFGVCFSAGVLIVVSRYYHVETLNIAAFHTTFYLLSAVILSSLLIFRQLRAGDGETMLR